LSVGDAEFQKKCLGKMETVGSQGRTVLFVSHQMGAIQRLCSRCMVLQNGRLAFDGPAEQAISHYLSSYSQSESIDGWFPLTNVFRRGTGEARFVAFKCVPPNRPDESHLYPDEPADISILLHSDSERQVGSLAVTFYDRVGTKLVNADTITLGESMHLQQGENLISVRLDKLHLNPGLYHIGFWLANPPQVFDHIELGGAVEVIDYEAPGLGHRADQDGVVTCSFAVTQLSRP